MPQVGFEPTILVSEWPQTHALDRTSTGIGLGLNNNTNNKQSWAENEYVNVWKVSNNLIEWENV
jgi:hypothetical protein